MQVREAAELAQCGDQSPALDPAERTALGADEQQLWLAETCAGAGGRAACAGPESPILLLPSAFSAPAARSAAGMLTAAPLISFVSAPKSVLFGDKERARGAGSRLALTARERLASRSPAAAISIRSLD